MSLNFGDKVREAHKDTSALPTGPSPIERAKAAQLAREKQQRKILAIQVATSMRVTARQAALEYTRLGVQPILEMPKYPDESMYSTKRKLFSKVMDLKPPDEIGKIRIWPLVAGTQKGVTTAIGVDKDGLLHTFTRHNKPPNPRHDEYMGETTDEQLVPKAHLDITIPFADQPIIEDWEQRLLIPVSPPPPNAAANPHGFHIVTPYHKDLTV